MSFGKREMDILSMLIGRRGWVTGEEMASAFGISKKTVQQEIRRISGEFGDGCRILSSQKKGYCLEYLSDELRRGIIRHLEQNEVQAVGQEEPEQLPVKPYSAVGFIQAHHTIGKQMQRDQAQGDQKIGLERNRLDSAGQHMEAQPVAQQKAAKHHRAVQGHVHMVEKSLVFPYHALHPVCLLQQAPRL